ncbi:cytochrome c [Haloferula helveola]|uniref:Cytochrome c n=1 Tax=Haloferula helveola TaxID=490095 RepID=A0ABM7REU6_9BACT|nr:cytochrome c [Haloferula helveola]
MPSTRSFALLFSLAAPVAVGEGLKKRVDPLLYEYCYDCHDEATTKAGLDLEALPFAPNDPANFALWQQVHDRVEHHEMPPKKKDQPTDKERRELVDYLKTDLLAADRAEIKEHGRVRGRRLTRVEYEHTLHDLLGIRIPLADQLPADESDHEFDNVAVGQQLSHFHLNQYLQAADIALEEAFGRLENGDEKWKRTYSPRELATVGRQGNYRGPEERDGKAWTWAMRLQFVGRMIGTNVPESGWYRITIKDVVGVNPGPDGAVWASLRTGACVSNEPMMYPVASVEATPQPRDHSYVAWMRKGHVLELRPNEGTNKFTNKGQKGGKLFYKGQDYRKDGIPGIGFGPITLERIYPGGSRGELLKKLLPGVPLKGDQPAVKDANFALSRLIRSFAERAFRRPVTEQQVAPYIELANAKLKETQQFAPALRAGYQAVLCSPRFLTFVETPGRLDDHALATRLSYFLWSSTPDAELRKLADAGRLREPGVLHGQVERLLSDPKAERFIEHFTDQWLNLREIDFTSPDPRRFGSFDPVVQDSMVLETRGFVRELLAKDLSVRNFIRSDFAFLNTRLQTHYGMKDVTVVPGKGLQKVPVKPGQRSGLVTQGSILKVTADGSVTSPVLRGVWIGERLLGLHIPPPPPNVGAIEPDIRGATSIRDQLEKHRSEASCASCHEKIDPQGFALESFDPTGQWRSRYGNSPKSAKVDPSGITPDGSTFKDIQGWKEIYHSRPEQLATAFAGHLLTYGTGAPVRFSDREAIAGILTETKKNGHGVRSLVHAIVRSEPFQHK